MTRAPTQPGAQAPAQGELFAPTGDATGPSCPIQPERDVRVRRATRSQMTWGRVDLDAELPADHPARAIMAVLDKLDLRGLYAGVRARGETAGAAAIDPKILLGLWPVDRRHQRRRRLGPRDRQARPAPCRLPLALRRRRRRLPPAQ